MIFFFTILLQIKNVWQQNYTKINNRFPNSKKEEWEKIFPSFTTKGEIGLVDSLVKYNPKQRLTAAEVSVLHETSLMNYLRTFLLSHCRHFVMSTLNKFTADSVYMEYSRGSCRQYIVLVFFTFEIVYEIFKNSKWFYCLWKNIFNF